MNKLTDNYKITSLAYEDVIPQFAKRYMLTIEEAKEVVKNLSFSEYASLLKEAIVPPSQQTPGQTQVNQPGQTTGTTGPSSGVKVSYAGQGTPIQTGMQVGIKNPKTGLNMPNEVVKYDMTTKAVTVKDPTTGQQQTYNEKDLLPLAADGQTTAPQQNTGGSSGNPMPRTTSALQGLMQSYDYGDKEIKRIRELAGIKEDGSGGGCGAGGMAGGGTTTAGNIAGVAQPLGKIKKRQPQHEEIRTPDPKRNVSIQGKIDPNAATGELSTNLANRKMKTASRKNNGKKAT